MPPIDPTGQATGTVNTERPDYGYQYDSYGNQTAITDPNGHTTRFTYDHFGRQLTRTLPLGVINGSGYVESMQYDPVYGQMVLHTDFEGGITQYVYDNTAGAGGRLIEKRYFVDQAAFGTGTIAERVTYSYDAFGRQTQVVQDRDGDLGTTADQTVTTFAYDAEGRRTLVSTKQGDDAAKAVNYEYDDLGRLIQTSTADTDVRYTCDALNRLELLERGS